MGCVGPPELKLIKRASGFQGGSCSEVRWNKESGNTLASAIVVACVVGWDPGLCLDSLCLRVFHEDLESSVCVCGGGGSNGKERERTGGERDEKR